MKQVTGSCFTSLCGDRQTEPPPAEMQRGGFFCRTDSTCLTDFCAIVLVVWERLCNFDLRSKVGCISEIKTKKAFFVLYFARFALPLHDDETGKDFSTIRLDSHHAPTAWCIDAGAAGQAVGG